MLDENMIDEFMGGFTGGDTLFFAAQIGNCYLDEIDWVVEKNGRRSKVTLPRAAHRFEREQPMRNFWLIEMSAAAAKHFKVEHMALDGEEIAAAKERISNGK